MIYNKINLVIWFSTYLVVLSKMFGHMVFIYSVVWFGSNGHASFKDTHFYNDCIFDCIFFSFLTLKLYLLSYNTRGQSYNIFYNKQETDFQEVLKCQISI